jgi:hypothetical protein
VTYGRVRQSYPFCGLYNTELYPDLSAECYPNGIIHVEKGDINLMFFDRASQYISTVTDRASQYISIVKQT